LSRPPQAGLQLALDLPSLRVCRAVVAALTPRPARVEVGTPLLLHEGIRAVEWLRGELGPAGTVVADAKICDAGARIARDAFAAGADVVTVVGAAADLATWEGVLQAAQGSPGRPAVMIDTIGWEPEAAVTGDRGRRPGRRLAGFPQGGHGQPPQHRRPPVTPDLDARRPDKRPGIPLVSFPTIRRNPRRAIVS